MRQNPEPNLPVDDRGRPLTDINSDGKPALRTMDADARTNREILLNIEAFMARQVWILEQAFMNGQSTKDITTEDVI